MIRDAINTVLRKHADEPLVHHVRGFLHDCPARCKPGSEALVEEPQTAEARYQKLAQDEGHYTVSFAKGLLAAKDRIAAGYVPKVVVDRESQKHKIEGLSPWMRAQIDVYQCIAESQWPGEDSFTVADTSQSANRGGVNGGGELPCVTTSSRIYAYRPHRFLTPGELMACHGFTDYDFSGLTFGESCQLVGKGMAATSLVAVLTPVLKHLGFLAA